MIKGIIFDCFGVLYRDNISMLYDAVPRNMQRDLRDIIHATDFGMLSREDYYMKIAEISGNTPEEIAEIESRQHVRDESMISYTQTFKPKYKVGLLSNIDVDSMNRMFPSPQREELFDAFVVSGEVGVTKPSAQIFNIAATRLGLLPEECVMIDDLISNVEGAQMAGMHALLFTNQRQLDMDIKQLLERLDA